MAKPYPVHGHLFLLPVGWEKCLYASFAKEGDFVQQIASRPYCRNSRLTVQRVYPTVPVPDS
ncbi:MAG: hypothetical protein KJ900_04370 [Proteobacteria bacterium]|nr:hypothetical protein [Pseudomonadota bacterium]MCG2744390.1 hypothetical protein [Desulfobacteraceae bacterium]MBU3984037.1 hypothetical protein [Pseudomonadota bacterium]MBU4042119.1 hypothetical protein [Pseudomonadota bacterium]MBU4084896.1 hypothetical protein [Pseudomonadota bacterium]